MKVHVMKVHVMKVHAMKVHVMPIHVQVQQGRYCTTNIASTCNDSRPLSDGRLDTVGDLKRGKLELRTTLVNFNAISE